MRTTNKIISVLLTLLLGFSVFSFVFAEEVTNSEQFTENLAILKSVGLDIGLSDEENIINREKLSEYALSLTKREKITATQAKYNDVPLKHYASDLVYTVDYYNLVKGKSDNNFSLSENSTIYDFGRVLLIMLGYDVLAVEEEWSQADYSKWLSKTALTRGVNGSALTEGNMAIMLVNLLTEPVLTVKAITNEGVEYYFSDKALYITENLNAIKLSGTLQAAGEVSLTGVIPVIEGKIVISGVTYKYEKNVTEHLGSKVTFYATNDKSLDYQTVIHLSAKAPEKELIIEADDIINYSSNILNYEKDGKKATVSINKNKILVIQNGKRATNVDFQTFCPVAGSVRLVDTDGNNQYDICFVTSKIYSLLSEVVIDTATFTDRDTKKSIKADPDYLECYQDGSQTDISSIEKGTFVALMPDGVTYNTKNGSLVPEAYSGFKNLRVEVYSDTVVGEVTEKSTDGVTVTVEGEEEPVFVEYSKWYKNMLSAGIYTDFDLEAPVTVYRDNGKAVYIKSQSVFVGSARITSYGYILGIDQGRNAFDTMKFKIFTEDGEMLVANAAENIRLNGGKASYNTFTANTKLYKNASLVPQIITFKLNANEEITDIYTAIDRGHSTFDNNGTAVANPDYSATYKGYDLDAFTLDFANSAQTYRNGFKHLYSIDDNTKLFVIPIDSLEEKYFKIRTKSYLINTSVYNVELYDVQSDFKASCAVVYVNAKSGSEEIAIELYPGNVSSMVQKKVTAVDDSGEARPLVYLMENQYPFKVAQPTGAIKAVFASDDEMISYNGSRYSGGIYPNVPYADLEPGDVIMFKRNDLGEMSTFRVLMRYRDLYDSQGNFVPREINTSDPTASMYNTCAVVTDIYEDCSFTFNVDPNMSISGLRSSATQNLNAQNLAVMLYDAKNAENPITSCTLKELRIGDTIVTRSESGRLLEVFIYRK